jgi:type IV secretion system protein VirB11
MNARLPPRLLASAGLSSSDNAVFGDVLASDIAVRNYLAPLQKHYAGTGATELWINRPGQLILEVEGTVRYIDEPAMTFEALEAFAQAVAIASPQQQHVGTQRPLLSATLPDGERIQIVLPPAVEPGQVSMSIRIPSDKIIPLDVYQTQGAFDKYTWPRPKGLKAGPTAAIQSGLLAQLSPVDAALAQRLVNHQLKDFLIAAVKAKKNIAVVGDTGSGKTTLMKSMCQFIPSAERLVTIEDVRELMLPHHPNRVHLLYTKGRAEQITVTPAELIASCMRMAPSRVLLAELRGSEAWDFLKLLTTGHAGSITSWHAESCALSFERFMFMAKENVESASLSRSELKHLALLTLDIVIHVTRALVAVDGAVKVERYVDEVFFDPWAKNSARYGHNEVNVC